MSNDTSPNNSMSVINLGAATATKEEAINSNHSVNISLEMEQHHPAGIDLFLIFSTFVVALGMFNFGYHVTELNGIQDALSCQDISLSPTTLSIFSAVPACIPLTKTDFSIVTAAFSIGGLIGAILAGHYCDLFGRKKTMFANTVLMFVCPLLLTFASNLTMLVIGRLFAGIVSGGSTILVPTYLNEISPNRLRGILGSISQIAVVTGLLMGALFGNYWIQPQDWRLCVGILLIPVTFRLICVPFLVESPKFLASSSTSDKVLQSLKKLRADTSDATLLEEIESWEHVVHHTVVHHSVVKNVLSDHHPIGLFAFLKDPIYRHSLFLICLVHATQQLSGIHIIFSYTWNILLEIGLSASTARLCTVLIIAYNVVATIACTFLIERIGRKKLLVYSSFVMSIGLMLVPLALVGNVGSLALFGVFVALTGYCLGLGSIPFMLTAEVVETKAIGSASTCGLTVNWISQFVVAMGFLALLDTINHFAFFIFAGYLIVAGLLLSHMLVETKGKSGEEVLEELAAKKVFHQIAAIER